MYPFDLNSSSPSWRNSPSIKPTRLTRSLSSIATTDESSDATKHQEKSPSSKARSFYAASRKISMRIIGALRGKSRRSAIFHDVDSFTDENREVDRSIIGPMDEDSDRTEDSAAQLEEEPKEGRVKKGRSRYGGSLRRILSVKGKRRLLGGKPLDEYAKRKLERSRDSGWEGTSSSSSSSLSSLLAADPGFSTSSPVAKPSYGTFEDGPSSTKQLDVVRRVSSFMHEMDDEEHIQNSMRKVDTIQRGSNFIRMDDDKDSLNSTRKRDNIQRGSNFIRMDDDEDSWNSTRKLDNIQRGSNFTKMIADEEDALNSSRKISGIQEGLNFTRQLHDARDISSSTRNLNNVEATSDFAKHKNCVQNFSIFARSSDDVQDILNSTKKLEDIQGTENSTRRTSSTEDTSVSSSIDVDSGFGDCSPIVKMSFDDSFLHIWNSTRKMNSDQDTFSSSPPDMDSDSSASSLIAKDSPPASSQDNKNSTKPDEVQRTSSPSTTPCTSNIYPRKTSTSTIDDFHSHEASYSATRENKVCLKLETYSCRNKTLKSFESIQENIHGSQAACASEVQPRNPIEGYTNLQEVEEREFSIPRAAEERRGIGQVCRETYWRFKRRGISKSAADLFEGSFLEACNDDVTEFGSLDELRWCAASDFLDIAGSSRRAVMGEETTSRGKEDLWEEDCPPGMEEQRASVFVSEEEEEEEGDGELLEGTYYESKDRSYVITMYV